MPAATTHVLSALDIYNRLPEGRKTAITNQEMFCLGAQGPDLFFFYNFGAKSEIRDIGSYMHNHQVFEVINYMFNYIKKVKSYNLLSYFYGYLCHYALDSSVHPIVYNRSKYGNLTDESELIIHFRIEAFYDQYVLKKKNLKFKTDEWLYVSNKEAREIAVMYHNLFKDLFNKEIAIKELTKNCKQVSTVLRLLKPNFKLKFKLVEKYEELLKKPKAVSSLMLYNDFKDHDYVLNTAKDPFHNVTDENITYNSSFDELYENGIEKGVYLILNPLDKNMYTLDFDGNLITGY